MFPCDGETFTRRLEDFSVRDVLCIVDELLRLKGSIEIEREEFA